VVAEEDDHLAESQTEMICKLLLFLSRGALIRLQVDKNDYSEADVLTLFKAASYKFLK
jgi:hypothetical protein